MSCMFLPDGGGGGQSIQPIDPRAMQALGTDGLAALHALYPSLAKAKPPLGQFIGASVRPDERPFYLTILAPQGAPAKDAWLGGFYAPFGYFHVVGSVQGKAHSAEMSSIAVSAVLALGGKKTVAAQWKVLGPAAGLDTLNTEAMMQSVTVSAKGPHDERDIRACIARHAPLSSFGEPRAVVARQCGVALACLIEAVC